MSKKRKEAVIEQPKPQPEITKLVCLYSDKEHVGCIEKDHVQYVAKMLRFHQPLITAAQESLNILEQFNATLPVVAQLKQILTQMKSFEVNYER